MFTNNRMIRLAAAATVAAAVWGFSPALVLAQDAPAAATIAGNQKTTEAAAKAQATIDKAIAFMKSQQKPDGGWQGEKDPPGITAIVLKAVVQDPSLDANTDWVKKGFDKLLSYQLEDGGIYKDTQANYNTSIALSALAKANHPAFKDRIDKALAYLKKLQWTEQSEGGPKGEGKIGPDHTWHGGSGYGRHSRPDGSNTQLTLEAYKDAGMKADDPAMQAALKFVTRMQNLSEKNDQKQWAGDDGGAIYTPANNGESFAGEYKDAQGNRRLRSYGSMTYAILKSYIYAGLTRDDPRVKAAWDWITRNWTLDENPGLAAGDPKNAQHGMYYYYHTLGRALNVYDQPVITDPQGRDHDWRVELIDKLASLQKADGSWVGEERWMEGNPVLVTSYTILALQEALMDLQEHPVK